MARPDHEGPGALRQLVVGVQPPEDDALEYVVHGFNEGISNPDERAQVTAATALTSRSAPGTARPATRAETTGGAAPANSAAAIG
jgi:hypothetical protein